MSSNEPDIDQMYKIANYVCRNVPSRFKEDWVQECVIKQYKSLPYFDNRCKLSTYLNTVAKNRLKDMQSHHKAKLSKEILMGHDEIIHETHDSGFAEVEKKIILDSILKQITHPTHKIVAKAIIDNPTHTYEEIGDKIGMQRRQINGIVFRILANLKKI